MVTLLAVNQHRRHGHKSANASLTQSPNEIMENMTTTKEKQTKPFQAKHAGNGEEATKHDLDGITAAWKKAHETRTATIEAGLLKQRSEAGPDERLLLQLAAHDAALCEKLGEAELQLANRVVALIDNAAVALALSRTLERVAAVRELTTRRMQGLLETAGVLRGQRKLAETAPLRRVS